MVVVQLYHYRADGQVAYPQTLAELDRDVFRREIEAARRHLQGDGRVVLVVVTQHQGLAPVTAVDVQDLVQMADGKGVFADARNRGSSGIDDRRR